jgi:hypothetical protein
MINALLIITVVETSYVLPLVSVSVDPAVALATKVFNVSVEGGGFTGALPASSSASVGLMAID